MVVLFQCISHGDSKYYGHAIPQLNLLHFWPVRLHSPATWKAKSIVRNQDIGNLKMIINNGRLKCQYIDANNIRDYNSYQSMADTVVVSQQ